MNYKCTLVLAIIAVLGFGKASFAADGDDSKNEVKTRLQKVERGSDIRLLMELCASTDQKYLNIADALDEETALFMLGRGADVNKACEVCLNEWPNDSGTTALHAAANWNSIRLIDALLKKGAKVDVKGKMDRDTPLHMAAYSGNPEAVERLLKAGANPNLECAYGNALTCAVFAQLNEGPDSQVRNQRYLKVISLLVAAGADVHGKLDSGESISEMVLKSKNPLFLQQARLALRLDQPQKSTLGGKSATNQPALSGLQVANALTTASFNNLSVLVPLLKHSDSDVRFRALERINEIAENRGSGMKLDSQLYLEIEDRGISTTLLDRKWFSPELMSSIVGATNDPVPKVRAQANRVLSIIDLVDNNITKLITTKLSSDSDPKVRLRCAETLAWLATTQRKDLMPEIEKSVHSAMVHEGNGHTRLGEALVLQFLHREMRMSHTGSSGAEPTILAQEFGFATQMNPIRIKETRTIPCREKTLYKICVVPDHCEKPAHIKVKLTMPEAKTNWPTEPSLFSPLPAHISADKKVATYESDLSDSAHSITWQIDNEDRPGKYKIEVFLNDRLTKTYDFEMVASK